MNAALSMMATPAGDVSSEPTNTHNKPSAPPPPADPNKPRLLTDDEFETVMRAFRVLHGVFAPMGKTPEKFEQCGLKDHENLLQRALKGAVRYKEAKREEYLRGIRAAVESVFVPYIAEALKAKAEYDALSASLRAMVGPFRTSVEVPLSAFKECFPQGVGEDRQVKLLHEMKLKVGKNAQGVLVVSASLPTQQ